MTKPFEYYVAPSLGFDNVNLLDAFLNIHFDDRAPVQDRPFQDTLYLRVLQRSDQRA